MYAPCWRHCENAAVRRRRAQWRLARKMDFADGWWWPGRSGWPRRSRWRCGADGTALCPARVNCRPSRGRPAVPGPGWRKRRRRTLRQSSKYRSRNPGRSNPTLGYNWCRILKRKRNKKSRLVATYGNFRCASHQTHAFKLGIKQMSLLEQFARIVIIRSV